MIQSCCALFMLKLSAFSLKNYPSGIEAFNLLCVSKCNRTETIVIVRTAVIVVEIEHSCTVSIVEITPTFEERILQTQKVRVVQFNPVLFYYVFSKLSMNKRELKTRKYLKCNRTETIVIARTAVTAEEIEHSCTVPTVEITPTYEERTLQTQKVRVVVIPAVLPCCTI